MLSCCERELSLMSALASGSLGVQLRQPQILWNRSAANLWKKPWVAAASAWVSCVLRDIYMPLTKYKWVKKQEGDLHSALDCSGLFQAWGSCWPKSPGQWWMCCSHKVALGWSRDSLGKSCRNWWGALTGEVFLIFWGWHPMVWKPPCGFKGINENS